MDASLVAASSPFARVEVDGEATAFGDVSELIRNERARAPRPTPGLAPKPGRRLPPPPFSDEPTRLAGDDAPPRSMTDVDWDLD